MQEELGSKSSGCFCHRSLLSDLASEGESPGAFTALLLRDTGNAAGPQAPRPAGRARISPVPAGSAGKKGAPGGLRGSLLGIATTFLTPHQPGVLARHLGASSRAARACDSPRSRGGFGCLPRWRAQPSVAEPLWALPAPAGAGSESGDKRACVRLPAAGPAERPPAQLNCARFPCGRGARKARWPPPATHRPPGLPPRRASPADLQVLVFQ